MGIIHDHSSQLNKFVGLSYHTIPVVNAIWKVKKHDQLVPQLQTWPHSSFTKHFRYLKWRYSPIEAVRKAYVRENPPEKLPYKVQYLHFRYPKLLVKVGLLEFPKLETWV